MLSELMDMVVAGSSGADLCDQCVPTRQQPAGRRLLHVLELSHLRPLPRQRRLRFHIGPNVRGVCAYPGEHPDPQVRQDLRLQRRQLPALGRQVEEVHGRPQGPRAVRQALLCSVYRQLGRRLPPDFALRWDLWVPKRQEEQERQVEAIVRVCSDELPG